MPTEPNPFRIAAVGELLWDMMPEGVRLGGAPANFIAMVAALGDEAYLVSCVGDDDLGKRALGELVAHRVGVDYISCDRSRPTGSVTVTLDAKDGPSYRIHEDVAWDHVAASPSLMALAPTLDAICFGTLAQRSAATKATLRQLVDGTRPDCLRVFDVNLRPPFWTPEALAWGCSRATILKMNHEEVALVAEAVGAPAQGKGPLQAAQFFLERFSLQLVAITRGGKGCLLVARDEVQDHPGIATTLVDSIGAGDAFTAALTHSALRGSSLASMAEAANRWGAWVASQPGGMPWVDAAVHEQVIGPALLEWTDFLPS
ncbi:MAG: PfkB family carbohydrate kinase [Acidobacteriaceae bacterium]